MQRRVFVGEIATPGCSLVYAAGPRRFAMLCADGALLTVTLDAAGREAGRERSKPFFDPGRIPSPRRRCARRQLALRLVRGAGAPGRRVRPRAALRRAWSLFDRADREDGWRIGGQQHLALHEPSGRLYSLVHQGGPDTHKEPGKEVWVYDLAARKRVQRIPLRNPGFTYLGFPIAPDLPWPFSRIRTGCSPSSGAGVGSVAVTQDDQPLLVTGSQFSGSLGIYDALSGEFLRRVAPGNMTTLGLQTPWTGSETAR